MRVIRLGDEDQPASLLVEAMNDAGPDFAAHGRQTSKVMQESVDECSTIALIVRSTGAGVDHHSCRLVDDGEVVILVDNFKRNVFWQGAKGRTFSSAQYDNLLVSAKFQGCLGRLMVD